MNIDITEIVIALIGLASLIITSVVVPWVKSKTNAEQQSTIRTVVTIAVYAAQQLFSKEEVDNKKAYALKQIETMLATYNITLSTDEISTYIEGILKDIKTENGSEWSNE